MATYLNVVSNYNKILITESNDSGEIRFREDCFEPEVFVPELEDSGGFKTLLENDPLRRIKFEDIAEYRSYTREKEYVENFEMFNLIAPEYQYIRQMYSKSQPVSSYKYWHFDIETDLDEGDKFSNPKGANAAVTFFQIKESDTGNVYVFSWLGQYTPKKKNVTYFYCENEYEMFTKFIKLMYQRKPWLIHAWFGDNFDFLYIVNRSIKLGFEEDVWSPFGIMKDHKAVIFGKVEKIKKPEGIIWLDTVDVYKKLNPGGREKWSLDFIAKYHKIESKLDWGSSGFRSFKDFIRGNYDPEYDEDKTSILYKLSQKDQTSEIKRQIKKEAFDLFVDYSIRDVEVLYALDQKLKLFDVMLNIQHTMRCNMYDVLGTTKPWTIFIYNELYDKKIAIPDKTKMSDREYGGGYVYAMPGKHGWVMTLDVASMYPSAIRQGNLSPETYVPIEKVSSKLRNAIFDSGIYLAPDCEYIYMNLPMEKKEELAELLKLENLSMGVNGTLYQRDKFGIIPELVERIYYDRKEHKKKMKEAQKIVESIKIELKERGEDVD